MDLDHRSCSTYSTWEIKLCMVLTEIGTVIYTPVYIHTLISPSAIPHTKWRSDSADKSACRSYQSKFQARRHVRAISVFMSHNNKSLQVELQGESLNWRTVLSASKFTKQGFLHKHQSEVYITKISHKKSKIFSFMPWLYPRWTSPPLLPLPFNNFFRSSNIWSTVIQLAALLEVVRAFTTANRWLFVSCCTSES